MDQVVVQGSHQAAGNHHGYKREKQGLNPVKREQLTTKQERDVLKAIGCQAGRQQIGLLAYDA
jgi:hypothetical protein